MDLVTLITKDNKEMEVEIVMSFKIDEFNSDYVIYKDSDGYYAAKYIVKDNTTILDTDLTEKEKNSINLIFEELKKEGVL